MRGFSVRKILHRAYQYTLKNPWLWVFGIFASGSDSLGLEVMDRGFGQPNFSTWIENSVSRVPAELAGFVLLILLFLAVILVVQALAKTAILWSIGEKELAGRRAAGVSGRPLAEINFRTALKNARKYFLAVLGVQILLVFSISILAGLYLWPVSFLWSAGATGRGMILAILGLLIFIPAIVIFALIYATAPVFIVVLKRKTLSAVSLALALLRRRPVECLWLGLMLFVAALLLLFLIGSSMILFSSLAEQAGFLTTGLAAPLTIFAVVIWTILLQAVFSVFYNSAWVVAVLQLVGTVSSEEQEEEYAAEPAS